MPIAPANGIEIYYETHGDPKDPALLLVHGYTAQIAEWAPGFREGLAARGRYVISFDNRDVGLSTHLDGVTVDIRALNHAIKHGTERPPVPYTLSTFAADSVALLDHLWIGKAHIAGCSMGGMIVQTIACEHPDRVLTLTSIMSTTNEPGYMEATPEATDALLAPPPLEREAYIADAVERARIYCSKKYFDPEAQRQRKTVAYDRNFDPSGWARQLAAIRASASRVEALRSLTIPTLVIHGRDDTLIMPSGGFRTAEIIPGANLLFLGDMGHDLPRPLWPLIFDAIISHTTGAI
jgi:pimeloyl-ACP methyl ester carboxylesterase